MPIYIYMYIYIYIYIIYLCLSLSVHRHTKIKPMYIRIYVYIRAILAQAAQNPRQIAHLACATVPWPLVCCGGQGQRGTKARAAFRFGPQHPTPQHSGDTLIVRQCTSQYLYIVGANMFTYNTWCNMMHVCIALYAQQTLGSLSFSPSLPLSPSPSFWIYVGVDISG